MSGLDDYLVVVTQEAGPPGGFERVLGIELTQGRKVEACLLFDGLDRGLDPAGLQFAQCEGL